ncbi:threonine/homoserine/homoserine lactone efflux protein [Sinobacterium caligoides]|uniref:Threonine/homoserine/homoserine lactone efflux protein n=1 Tax=Sinobacterium caligoides TaxID=933926 RepID=A0A3N2DPB3_9GAMM|nr:LysE family translocator [Sinobacterium caligoides]ROS01654.1 threonine/homoserine/homoserine lactone efflux protein [Sinobacterium caligoides]
MTWLNAVALATTMLILVTTPGPGVFAVVSRALASGFRVTMPLVFGMVCADLIFLCIAIFGLSLIAGVLDEFFVIVKYLGASYLVWMAYKIWRSKPTTTISEDDDSNERWPATVASGLMIGLSNPKVILFYLGLLPTFVDLGSLDLFGAGIIVAIIFTIAFSVLTGYAYTAAKARHLFQSERASIRLNRLAASAMTATAVAILLRQ